jgi:hypothetical protein
MFLRMNTEIKYYTKLVRYVFKLIVTFILEVLSSSAAWDTDYPQ